MVIGMYVISIQTGIDWRSIFHTCPVVPWTIPGHAGMSNKVQSCCPIVLILGTYKDIQVTRNIHRSSVVGHIFPIPPRSEYLPMAKLIGISIHILNQFLLCQSIRGWPYILHVYSVKVIVFLIHDIS